MIRKRNIKNSEQVKVSFVLPVEHDQAKGSAIVGDFNDWDASANLLKKRSNGTYSAVITLDKGQKYMYRYVSVDGTWFNVADADEYVSNDMGTENGVLLT